MQNHEHSEFEKQNSEELETNQNGQGETKSSIVRVMQKPAMEAVYRKLGFESVRILSYINTLEDNLGHMYSKSTGRCRFKSFNEIGPECAARIEFEDIDDNETGWKNVMCVHNFPHTHPSPILNPGGLQNLEKAVEKNSFIQIIQKKMIPEISTSVSSQIGKEKSRIVKDSEFGANKRRVNEADEKGNTGKNQPPSQVRVMTSGERNSCYGKLGLENMHKRGRIVIDSDGHIYGPRGPTFRCKFDNWDKYDRKCYAEISVEGGMKKWIGWAKIDHCSKGHTHPIPFPDLKLIQGTLNEHLGQSDEDSESEYSMDIEAPSKKRSRVNDNDSTQNIDTSTISSGNRNSNNLSSVVSNEASISATKLELEPNLTPKSTPFVTQTMSFDQSSNLSSFARPNSTTQPQLHSTPMVSNTLPTFNFSTSRLPKLPVTSQQQPLTQLENTLGPDRRYLMLPAWTNCVQCKACILIDPKSTTKDLIETAEKHISQFHGHKIMNKQIINQHLPYILTLREVEQLPVCGSLSLNEGGDFWCAINSCDQKMMNMRDVTLNDNDMINHVIKQHLAAGELMTSEILWECFPITSPQNQPENREEIGIPTIKLE